MLKVSITKGYNRQKTHFVRQKTHFVRQKTHFVRRKTHFIRQKTHFLKKIKIMCLLYLYVKMLREGGKICRLIKKQY